MEAIKKEEMLFILGGYDAEECKRVQGSVTEDMSEEDWEEWLKEFDKYCL